jgi:antitoxin component HigA of HigAB toxin-antitoxin module
MEAEPGPAEEDELQLFSLLVEIYEEEHYPVSMPDPIQAIKFAMAQQGLTRKDLEPYIGSPSKVSEVLNGKRPLSLSMVRALEKGLGIPAEVLLQERGESAQDASTGKKATVVSSPAMEYRLEAESPRYSAVAESYSVGSEDYAERTPPTSKPSSNKAKTQQFAWGTNPAAVFERLCLVFAIPVEASDYEAAFSAWLVEELSRITRLYRESGGGQAQERLVYIEETLRTHARHNPTLTALALTLREMRGLMTGSAEKPASRASERHREAGRAGK